MPFTGSHPAAVLPFLGGRMPASALVIGTVVPDIPVYFTTQLTKEQTHAFTGVLGVDLVVGAFVFIVWHTVLVQPLAWISPAALQGRIPLHLRNGFGDRLRTVSDLGWLCLALAIGGLTHVVLDTFTTAEGWGARSLGVLNVVVLGLPLCRWLHLALSVVGLAWLARYLTDWWHRAPLVGPVEPVRPSLRWGAIALALGLATLAALIAVLGRPLAATALSGEQALTTAIVGFFSTLVIWLGLVAVAWHLTIGSGGTDSAAIEPPDHRAP